eukprot:1157032-Pelagomonas_calceolata.AAC.4
MEKRSWRTGERFRSTHAAIMVVWLCAGTRALRVFDIERNLVHVLLQIMGQMAQVEDEDAVPDDSVLEQDVLPLVAEVSNKDLYLHCSFGLRHAIEKIISSKMGEEDEEEDEVRVEQKAMFCLDGAGLDAEGNPKDQDVKRPSQENASGESDAKGTVELVKDASLESQSSFLTSDSGGGTRVSNRAPSALTKSSKKTSFKKAVAVAEGLESEWADWGLDTHWGRDASGCMRRVPSFYTGPSDPQKRKWMRQGSRW